MKTRILSVLGAIALASTAFGATVFRISWANPNPPGSTLGYLLQYRAASDPEAPWASIAIPPDATTFAFPENAYGKFFRIAATNATGIGEWSDTAMLPAKVSGLRILVEITP